MMIAIRVLCGFSGACIVLYDNVNRLSPEMLTGKNNISTYWQFLTRHVFTAIVLGMYLMWRVWLLLRYSTSSHSCSSHKKKKNNCHFRQKGYCDHWYAGYSAFNSLFVCLLVCWQDHTRSYSGNDWNVRLSPTQRLLDTFSDPDQHLDPGYDWKILWHCHIVQISQNMLPTSGEHNDNKKPSCR